MSDIPQTPIARSSTHTPVRQILVIGIGLLFANLLISLGLVSSNFTLTTSEGAYQIVPTSYLGFGTLGDLWFVAMLLGWIIALFYPLAAAISIVSTAIRKSNSECDEKLSDKNTSANARFSNCLFDSLHRLRVPLALLLGWTPGAALAVIFISTIGRSGFSYYPLELAPLTERVLMSFGASLGTWSLSVFAVVIGSSIGSHCSMWKSISSVVLILMPIILVMFVGSNDILVGMFQLEPTLPRIVLSVFTVVGPAILTVGFVILRGKWSTQ